MLEIELQIGDVTELELESESYADLELASDAVQVFPSGSTFPGPYEVTPTLGGLDVDTEGLFMEDDLTVKPIPIAKTTNPSGGYTCVIG